MRSVFTAWRTSERGTGGGAAGIDVFETTAGMLHLDEWRELRYATA
jgi:hypothetical protein